MIKLSSSGFLPFFLAIWFRIFCASFWLLRDNNQYGDCGINLEQIQYGSLQWRHNEHKGVSNHRGLDCLFNRQIKESIEAPRHWPLCEEFTGDRWITRTNGQ